jgi:hypothetical protein
VAENNEELELKPPSQEAVDAVNAALEDISGRSFSARHPELGKMINCKICTRRHRASIKCKQTFVELYIEEDLETGDKKTIYATAMQEPGIILPHQRSRHQPTIKQIVGAQNFKGRRRKPHPNKRNLQLIEQVRILLPDEYDDNDMKKARTRARRILSKKLGRHGFLPPVWMKQKEQANVESV